VRSILGRGIQDYKVPAHEYEIILSGISCPNISLHDTTQHNGSQPGLTPIRAVGKCKIARERSRNLKKSYLACQSLTKKKVAGIYRNDRKGGAARDERDVSTKCPGLPGYHPKLWNTCYRILHLVQHGVVEVLTTHEWVHKDYKGLRKILPSPRLLGL
jgi:hypothetical protein